MALSLHHYPVVDLRGDDLGTVFSDLPAAKSPECSAHIYVLAFGDLVKIGRTNNPRTRFTDHSRFRHYPRGGPLRRAWLSMPDPDTWTIEALLKRYCRAAGGRTQTSKYEVFLGLDVEAVIAHANSLLNLVVLPEVAR